MNYTKPEVAVLGEAAHMIEDQIHKNGTLQDAFQQVRNLNPAYDLDE